MNRILGLLIATGTALAAVHAAGEPTAVVIDVPFEAGPGQPCEFLGDFQRVEVREGATKIADLWFCSAYGRATAKVVTDAAGVSYLFLRLGEGHGTLARSEYLRIYRVAPVLDEYILQTPLSGQSNFHDRWQYSYAVSPLPDHGLRISLTLLPGTKDGSKRDKATYNPTDKTRVIDVGAVPSL